MYDVCVDKKNMFPNGYNTVTTQQVKAPYVSLLGVKLLIIIYICTCYWLHFYIESLLFLIYWNLCHMKSDLSLQDEIEKKLGHNQYNV